MSDEELRDQLQQAVPNYHKPADVSIATKMRKASERASLQAQGTAAHIRAVRSEDAVAKQRALLPNGRERANSLLAVRTVPQDPKSRIKTGFAGPGSH